MLYGYSRCSTNETKQHIDRQIRELLEQGVCKDNILFEYESGLKEDRKELNKLINMVKQGDSIICTEVSRITRSTKQLLNFLELAKEKKIKLKLGTFIVDFTNDTPDPMTLATIQLMGVFAELERNMISDRVKSGMKNAKAKGKQIGRSKTTVADIPELFIRLYTKLYLTGEINKSILSSLTKVSYPTTLKYIDMLEIQKG